MHDEVEHQRQSEIDPTHPVARQAAEQMPAARVDLAYNIPGEEGPSYYDISFLKPPLWRWEIASYFFVGGMSAGVFILSRLAGRFGGKEYAKVRRAGSLIAFASLLPAPPLLIHDLGDPKRFHHMLRVLKPGTPMSLGTWVLTSYSGSATAAVIQEWLDLRSTAEPTTLTQIRDAALMLVSDVAGPPLALLLAGYTGVLLSCTANPMWSKNPWIGPLFSASAVSAGASAITLALATTGSDPHGPEIEALENIDTISHLAEAASYAGYLKHAGPLARPLTHGSMKRHMAFALGTLVSAEVVKRLPLKGRSKQTATIVGAAMSLAGGFALRWAFVYGAHESGKDPHAARLSTSGRSRQGKFPFQNLGAARE